MTVGSGTPPATPLYNAMLTKVLLAIVMLFDSESRAHAHALVATNAATGPRGLVGSATGRRSSWWTHSAVRAALEPASPGAKRYTTRDVLLIGASVTALLCVIVLIVLL